MTIAIVGLLACGAGVVLGIVLAAVLDMRQHANEARAANAGRAAAQQYCVDADAHAEAVCQWMAQRYKGGAS